MRVAFVNQTGAKPGGAEESLFLLLRNLPEDIDPAVMFFEDGEFAQRLRDVRLAVKIIEFPKHLQTVTREKPFVGLASLPRAVESITRALSDERVDIVHTNTMKAHLLGSPAARLLGVPSVMHLRDMVGGSARLVTSLVGRSCSTERIAISNALDRWYKMPRTSVISNPVDLSQYGEIISPAEARSKLGIVNDGVPIIGIVGRINRWKGHDRLLRVVARVNRELPIRCVIVGEARFRDADFLPELHQLAAELGIQQRTTFIPWLDDPKIAYAALDVHCNCSEREPFGRSIVEAAAAGIPTVAFDDGGAVDIINDGEDGRLVPAGDIVAFSDAVIDLIRDPIKLRTSGETARFRSRRFAAPEHARRVAEVLRRNVRVK